MSTMQTIKNQLQNLLNSANAKTGSSHTNLTDGINELINGYGTSSGEGNSYSTFTITPEDLLDDGWSGLIKAELIGAKYFILESNDVSSIGNLTLFDDSGKIITLIYANGYFGVGYLTMLSNKKVQYKYQNNVTDITFDESTGTIAFDSKFWFNRLSNDTSEGDVIYKVHKFA